MQDGLINVRQDHPFGWFRSSFEEADYLKTILTVALL